MRQCAESSRLADQVLFAAGLVIVLVITIQNWHLFAIELIPREQKLRPGPMGTVEGAVEAWRRAQPIEASGDSR